MLSLSLVSSLLNYMTFATLVRVTLFLVTYSTLDLIISSHYLVFKVQQIFKKIWWDKGLEPRPTLAGVRSNRLSYKPILKRHSLSKLNSIAPRFMHVIELVQ